MSLSTEDLACDAAGRWKQRALAAEDDVKRLGNELADMRSWRDRVRNAFTTLWDAYYDDANVCGEIRCELVDDLDEALKS